MAEYGSVRVGDVRAGDVIIPRNGEFVGRQLKVTHVARRESGLQVLTVETVPITADLGFPDLDMLITRVDG